MRLFTLAAAAALLTPDVASATETIIYAYDAKGRLTGVARTGSVNNGMNAAYEYDKADNRIRIDVTGAGVRVVVVPLLGGTVIPLSRVSGS